MANEKSINKFQVTVLIDMEDFFKCKRKYGSEGDAQSVTILKAVKDAVKGVALTKKDFDLIEELRNKKLEIRMSRRNRT